MNTERELTDEQRIKKRRRLQAFAGVWLVLAIGACVIAVKDVSSGRRVGGYVQAALGAVWLASSVSYFVQARRAR